MNFADILPWWLRTEPATWDCQITGGKGSLKVVQGFTALLRFQTVVGKYQARCVSDGSYRYILRFVSLKSRTSSRRVNIYLLEGDGMDNRGEKKLSEWLYCKKKR